MNTENHNDPIDLINILTYGIFFHLELIQLSGRQRDNQAVTRMEKIKRKILSTRDGRYDAETDGLDPHNEPPSLRSRIILKARVDSIPNANVVANGIVRYSGCNASRN